MPITRPFRRTCRQFVNGSYSASGQSGYIDHPRFAISPQQYIRAFLLLQKDLLDLFDFVEPSDVNLKSYSYRIHELLMRTCIEVEANCKAILAENGYTKAGDWNMTDYKKLEQTHRLSSYQVHFPLWSGQQSTRMPFTAWSGTSGLIWYQAYNKTKHDRHREFEEANFENLCDAVSGLVVILASQFHTHDFAPQDYLVTEGPGDGFEVAIGSYFRVKFPDNWPAAERYDFNWQQLRNAPDPFQSLQL